MCVCDWVNMTSVVKQFERSVALKSDREMKVLLILLGSATKACQGRFLVTLLVCFIQVSPGFPHVLTHPIQALYKDLPGHIPSDSRTNVKIYTFSFQLPKYRLTTVTYYYASVTPLPTKYCAFIYTSHKYRHPHHPYVRFMYLFCSLEHCA